MWLLLKYYMYELLITFYWVLFLEPICLIDKAVLYKNLWVPSVGDGWRRLLLGLWIIIKKILWFLAGKTTQAKPRRGRGPAVHEALQRIPSQRRAIPQSTSEWHAPGDELFSCGPLDDKHPIPFPQDSSSDDDNMPDFGK